MSERQAIRWMELMCETLPPRLTAAGFSRGTCILHTRLATMLAREAGIRARPLRCNVVVANGKWLELAEELDRMPETREWRGGEWSLGIGHGREVGQPGYDGHVVVVVEERWVLDLTLDQANRPQHGINMHLGYFAVTPEWLRGETMTAFRRDGCFVQYEAVPEDRGFLTVPDWTEIKANDPKLRRLLLRAA
jgi:hypothetical protein